MEQWLSKAAPAAKGKIELRDQVATMRAETGAKEPEPPPPPSSRRRIAAASPYKGVQLRRAGGARGQARSLQPAAPARTATVAGVGIPTDSASTAALHLPPSLRRSRPRKPGRRRRSVRFGLGRALRPGARPHAPAAARRARGPGGRRPAALAAAPSGPHGDDARHRAHGDRARAPSRAPARAAARRASRRAGPRPTAGGLAGEPWPRARRASAPGRRPLRPPARGLPGSPRRHDGGKHPPARAGRRPLRPPARGSANAGPRARGLPAPITTPQPAPAAQPPPPPRLSIPEPPPRRPPLPSLLTIGPGRRSLSTFGAIIVSAFTATAVVSVALYLFTHRDKGTAGAASASASAAPAPPPSAVRTAAPAPSASASAGANPADLPYGFGYLTVASPAKANVYVSGKLAGPVNKALKVRCGRWFIRLAAPQEGRYPEWVSKGETVVVACQDSTRLDMGPGP